jgi:hypothetical protein
MRSTFNLRAYITRESYMAQAMTVHDHSRTKQDSRTSHFLG